MGVRRWWGWVCIGWVCLYKVIKSRNTQMNMISRRMVPVSGGWSEAVWMGVEWGFVEVGVDMCGGVV